MKILIQSRYFVVADADADAAAASGGAACQPGLLGVCVHNQTMTKVLQPRETGGEHAASFRQQLQRSVKRRIRRKRVFARVSHSDPAAGSIDIRQKPRWV